MANDSISIATSTKTENQAVNGGLTAGQALAKFYNVGARDVEAKLVGQMVRLNNATLNVPADLGTSLRAGDVISIYPQEIARGGVKGAVVTAEIILI